MQRKEFLFRWMDDHDTLPNAGIRTHRTAIAIGNVSLDLDTQSLPVSDFLRTFFANFPAYEPPALHVTVNPFPVLDDRLWDDEDAEFNGRKRQVVQRDFIAQYLDDDRVVAWINPAEIEDAIHNLLRWLLPPQLVKRSAFLFHSASITYLQEGFLFFGQSGAGKSTSVDLIRRHCDDITLLGDDACIIQYDRASNKCWLHSAPLGCGYTRLPPSAVRVPIRAMFALSQSDHHEIVPLTTSEAMCALLASTMCADFSEGSDARMDLAYQFAKSKATIGRLHFSMDAGFWHLAKETK